MNEQAAKQDPFSQGIWAIVYTNSGKSFVGCFRNSSNSMLLEDVRVGISIELHCAMEFMVQVLQQAIPQPGGMPPKIALSRNIVTFPIGRCFDVEETSIHVLPSDILFFDNMSKADRDWHQQLVRDGIRAAMEERLAASGITVPRLTRHNA